MPISTPGPLYIHPRNPRYFTADGARAVYLSGSHTWANLQDIGLPGGAPFPYEEFFPSPFGRGQGEGYFSSLSFVPGSRYLR